MPSITVDLGWGPVLITTPDGPPPTPEECREAQIRLAEIFIRGQRKLAQAAEKAA